MDIKLAYDLHHMKINSKLKIIIILVGAIIVFFAFTFSQKWGVTVAEKNTNDYKAKVKKLKNNYFQATRECPAIIKALKDGLPELEKNKLEAKIYLNFKLIADCEFAIKNYAEAANYYEKIITFQPNVSRWHLAYAQSVAAAGDYGEALRSAHLALQLERNNFDAAILEARLLAKLKNTIGAIEAYQNAVKIAPFKESKNVELELKRLVESHNQQSDG